MNIKDVMQYENIDFTGIESSYFLLGLLSAFDNRFQAMADKTMEVISWKQFFALICINLCKTSPTIKELAGKLGDIVANNLQFCVSAKESIKRAARQAMSRPDEECYDSFAVVDEGRYFGVVSIKELIRALAESDSVR